MIDFFRLFFEESSDALLAVELPHGRIAGANRSFSILSGFELDEIMGESLSILSSSLSSTDLRERRLDTEILGYPGFYNDIYLKSRDGQVRLLSVKVKHVQAEGRTLALAVLSDDTERQLLMRDLLAKHQSMDAAYTELEKVHAQLKVSQERIAQAAKLGALGEMAAGLSHELNQPLTGIRGFAQEILDLLKSGKTSKREVREFCTDIITNADKMAALLGHFRSFARQERTNFESEGRGEQLTSVDLVEAIAQVQRLLGRRLANQGVELETHFEGDGPFAVWALPHPVEQILVNLITNGRDALLEKKAQGAAASFRPRIRVQVRPMGALLEIRVRDNGPGVSSANQGKIFDPFFTTKSAGHGTGLGLSISFGLAHRFGGELVLESSSAQEGTSFVLRLPREQAESAKREVA